MTFRFWTVKLGTLIQTTFSGLKSSATSKCLSWKSLARISIDFPEVKYCCSCLYTDQQASLDLKFSLSSYSTWPTGLLTTKTSIIHTNLKFCHICHPLLLLSSVFLSPIHNACPSVIFLLLRKKVFKALLENSVVRSKRRCIIYQAPSQATQVESEWFKKLGGPVGGMVSSSSPRPMVSYWFSGKF